MKRLGIFCFYEKKGYVDKYIHYLLDDMILNLEHLVIVCNGMVDEEGYQIFKQYTDEIYIRDNHGFDGGAYQEVITKYLGVEGLKKWDELVLFNHTFFGPIYPFADVFQKVDEVECDFWGLYRQKEDEKANMPAHLQSFFLVVKKKMLHSLHFSSFWFELGQLVTKNDAIIQFELGFSQYFTENGYVSFAYSDVSEYEKKHPQASRIWTFFKPIELMRNFNFPIIKSKAFVVSRLSESSVNEILSYMKENTNYPIEYILAYFQRIEQVEEESVYQKQVLEIMATAYQCHHHLVQVSTVEAIDLLTLCQEMAIEGGILIENVEQDSKRKEFLVSKFEEYCECIYKVSEVLEEQEQRKENIKKCNIVLNEIQKYLEE